VNSKGRTGEVSLRYCAMCKLQIFFFFSFFLFLFFFFFLSWFFETEFLCVVLAVLELIL
jgi:hypothetical protein